MELQLLGRLRLHRQPDLQAIVDAVVVEDDMNLSGFRVGFRGQLVQKLQEQQAVLPLAFDVNESKRLGIPRAGKVTLLIAPWCQNLLLPPALGPVRSDLGIEMNVDLVEVQHDLVGGESVD